MRYRIFLAVCLRMENVLKIVNCTPHVVNLVVDDQKLALQPSRLSIRVKYDVMFNHKLTIEHLDWPVRYLMPVKLELMDMDTKIASELPNVDSDTLYIVSAITFLLGIPFMRNDFLCPDTDLATVDANHRTVSVPGLCGYVTPFPEIKLI